MSGKEKSHHLKNQKNLAFNQNSTPLRYHTALAAALLSVSLLLLILLGRDRHFLAFYKLFKLEKNVDSFVASLGSYYHLCGSLPCPPTVEPRSGVDSSSITVLCSLRR